MKKRIRKIIKDAENFIHVYDKEGYFKALAFSKYMLTGKERDSKDIILYEGDYLKEEIS